MFVCLLFAVCGSFSMIVVWYRLFVSICLFLVERCLSLVGWRLLCVRCWLIVVLCSLSCVV